MIIRQEQSRLLLYFSTNSENIRLVEDYNSQSVIKICTSFFQAISACQKSLTPIYLPEIHESVITPMVNNSGTQHILEQSWPDFLEYLQSDWRKAADQFAGFAYKVLQSQPPAILKTLNDDLRKEIIQLTVIHFIDNECRILKNYTDQGKPFKSWFYQVAYRKALDIVREKVRTDPRYVSRPKDSEEDFNIFDVLEDTTSQADADLRGGEILEIIAGALRTLKTKCQLLILGAASGFQAKQLAVLLGLGQKGNVTAANDLRYCRKQMKALLAKEGINLKEDII